MENHNRTSSIIFLIFVLVICFFAFSYLLKSDNSVSSFFDNLNLGGLNSGTDSDSDKSNNNNSSADYPTRCGFTVTSTKSGDKIKFPYTVKASLDNNLGKSAGCFWTRFEGQGGVVQVLANPNNTGWIKISRDTPLMLEGEWMSTTTTGIAKLEISEDVQLPIGTPIIIKVIEEDVMGSGLSDVLDVKTTYDGLVGDNISGETMKVDIFFHDRLGLGYDCRTTYKVQRVLPKDPAIANAVLTVLFNEDLTELKPFYNKITIKDKVAIVDFDKGALEYLNSAACMQGTFKGPIEDTLKQFPTIDKVEYSIDGKIWTEWDA